MIGAVVFACVIFHLLPFQQLLHNTCFGETIPECGVWNWFPQREKAKSWSQFWGKLDLGIRNSTVLFLVSGRLLKQILPPFPKIASWVISLEVSPIPNSWCISLYASSRFEYSTGLYRLERSFAFDFTAVSENIFNVEQIYPCHFLTLSLGW